ncbi:UDP-N-acetylglucosamine 2-epimerase [Candidatus Puniceispirillum sp.]|nr:UDP-N-acetylglucosamine 2-epimerase [Alphaproteobacteria bacterium]MDC1293906.1 UDP-N-acetylglucosamine 2-epimerase [Candidatus Puniceispirillum sp.]
MTDIRDIAVISVARSDYSILRPVLKKIDTCEGLNLNLIVSGMHLSPEFGMTVDDIVADGWIVKERIEHLVASDTPCGLSKSIGLGVIGFADLFSRYRPDVLVITGDRFEMLAAAIAAQPFGIPIAHIHGGETTEGAIDEVFRHSITKMSHLHFATTEVHKRRIIQLGERSDNVFLSGAPALDNLLDFEPMAFEAFRDQFNLKSETRPIVATYHPETIDFKSNRKNLLAIIKVLRDQRRQVFFTASNADTTGRLINKIVADACAENSHFDFKPNMGLNNYYQLLSHAKFMIGNSSSGIIEAGSFDLPVINVGNRQKGRAHGVNVIHTDCKYSNIQKSIEIVESEVLMDEIKKEQNPYFNGGSSQIICNALENFKITENVLQKKFNDNFFTHNGSG